MHAAQSNLTASATISPGMRSQKGRIGAVEPSTRNRRSEGGVEQERRTKKGEGEAELTHICCIAPQDERGEGLGRDGLECGWCKAPGWRAE